MTRFLLAFGCVALIAAAPVDPALRDSLVAGAALLPPSALAFERTIVATQSGGGDKANMSRVDRWDGRAWSAISLNGKPRTPEDAAKALKACPSNPVPGYYRLGTLLSRAAQSTDAQGRTIFHGSVPPGWITSSCKDISEHFDFAAIVSPDRKYVEQVRLKAREPFRMKLVAKIDSFVSVSEYAPAPDGKPRLTRQIVDVDGSMFGTSGVQHSVATFAYR